jgi:endonuclease YncB( thermonuclease family)
MPSFRTLAAFLALFCAATLGGLPPLRAQAPAPRPSPSPQPRPHAARVSVDPARVQVDDGDTVQIRWTASDVEQVRILGIDTPETRHVEHDLPYDQPFGREAEAFARGAFAAAERIELRRSSTLDPFGRTLGYLWIDGRNYSVMVVTARLAEESVTRYGDNGLPQDAAEVLAAARSAGPLPFESPGAFRARMREVSRWMKERGVYPAH